MAQLSYREAVAAGIAQEMRRDDSVVFLGEDVAAAGGVFKTTEGLQAEFGPVRVRDTPIAEQAILGATMGAAMTGLRPIAEIMFSDFFRGLLGYRRQPDRQNPVHVRRPVLVSARDSFRKRRRQPLRCATFAERRKLGDGRARVESGCAIEPGRRQRSAGGGNTRSGPGSVFRTKVALRYQGRSAGGRARGAARKSQSLT